MAILRPLLLVVLYVSTFSISALEKDYFTTPKLFSDQELSDMLDEKTLDMCWNSGEKNAFRFISSNDEIYFEVYLDQEPAEHFFSYKLNSSGQEERNISKMQQMPHQFSSIVADRRILNDAHPKQIDQAFFEKILLTKKVLFYTGAGISLASGVPAMNELNALLGLEMNEKFVFSLEKAVCSPRFIAEKIKIFHNACVHSSPTKAHFALRDLCLKNHTRIVTENLDCLHEKTGIFPYRIDPEHLRDEVGAESLAEFDYVICIGLSFDHRGFLGWYKKSNPMGKIISIDVQQPPYLGDEDFWIQADLQNLLPSLQNHLE